MVNKVTLVGHLGRDPEVRTLENGTKVGSFSLATTESYKDKNDTWQNLTEWHNIVVWRGLAERAERDLKKGSLAYVEGKITHRKYQDKEGQTLCQLCSVGKFSESTATGLISSCSSCAAGKYADTAGQSTCTKCPANKFSDR